MQRTFMQRIFSLIGSFLLTLPLHGAEPADISPRGNANRVEPIVTQEESLLLAQASQKAETDLAAAIALIHGKETPESSAALDFALGVFYSQNETYAKAAEAFRAAIKKLPRFRRAWKNLGIALLQAEEPEPAAAAFLTTLRIGAEGEENRLWKLSGYCHLLADNPVEAETCYRQALLFAPRDTESLVGLAKAFLSVGRAHDAAPILKRLIDEQPGKSEPWLLLSNAQLTQGNANAATETLESARRLELLKTRELLTLGDLYFNRTLYAEAFALYDATLHEEAASGDRALRCAEAAFGVGKSEKARTYLIIAFEKSLERMDDAYFLDGQLAEMENRQNAAREAYQKTLQHNPLHGRAMLALGRMEAENDQHEKALILFERASRIQATCYTALLEMTRLYASRNQYEQALAHANEANDLRPSRSLEKYIRDLKRVAQAIALQ